MPAKVCSALNPESHRVISEMVDMLTQSHDLVTKNTRLFTVTYPTIILFTPSDCPEARIDTINNNMVTCTFCALQG